MNAPAVTAPVAESPVVTAPATTSPRVERKRIEAPPPPPKPTPAEEAQQLLEEGRALVKRQRLREAESALRRCLVLVPQLARCHMMLGSTYAQLKQLERGAYHYRRFIELAPEDTNAARVRQLLKKYDESVSAGKREEQENERSW
jgi:tetratricopeptide (TPR) repeat protein